MVRVVIDTSVLIDEIRRGSELWDEIKMNVRGGKIQIISSVVVLTELWAGESMTYEKKKIIVEEMISMITFLNLDSSLAKKAGEIIRNYKISGFDAVIAATAIQYKAKLATLNKKHFENIRELKLYNETL